MVKSKRRLVTVSELAKTIQSQSDKNAAAAAASSSSTSGRRRRRSRRTRKKSANPQQTYIYASQRRQRQQESSSSSDDSSTCTTLVLRQNPNIDTVRGMGLTNPSGPLQCCEAIEGEEPTIVAVIPLHSEDDFGNTNAFAYVIDKPVGWTVLAGKMKPKNKMTEKKKKKKEEIRQQKQAKQKESKSQNMISVDDNDDNDDLDYDITAMLSQMTPDEIREFEREGGVKTLLSSTVVDRAVAAAVADMDIDSLDEQEVDCYVSELASSLLMKNDGNDDDTDDASADNNDNDNDNDTPAFQTHNTRPSILPWLKTLLSSQNTPIRGGKYWTPLVGATNAHDSGLLLLVPKDKKHFLQIHSTTYHVVMGNGHDNYLNNDVTKAPTLQKPTSVTILSHQKRSSIFDAKLVYTSTLSTVDDAVIYHAQSQFGTGVHGDPSLDPLDRRAHRRLVHVESLSLSSLVNDETTFYNVTSTSLPDDMRIATPKSNKYTTTRPNLRLRCKEEVTTGFREINGEADGYPGWIVDRYGSYLRVEQRSDDEAAAVGPMPPLPPVKPDGYTKGIYLVRNDRSTTSSSSTTPTLLHGTPPPSPLLPILENGITYLVSPSDKSSTGLFFDQRPQRAWLRRNVTPNTRLLNCFAHWGGYTIAAAKGGARETVSIDFDKRFLEHMKQSLEINGIETDLETRTHHDAIYGDVFDWIPRLLKKRGKASFDIVILDPPSTSVSILSSKNSKKKKRWSAANDYDDLVAMTKDLVAPGGLLWTTNNCAKLHPRKFANMCWRGLTDGDSDDDGGMEWMLERVVPMPEDHPCVGTPPVTNLVWRRLK